MAASPISSPRRRRAGTARRAAPDEFFRQLVAGMRNGVLAVAADHRLLLLNDEACRIFRLAPDPAHVGRPYADVLQQHPDIVRVLGGAFEMAALPNRAELRLKSTDTVIGYTLSLIRDDHDAVTGAALFFKDLTQVEQMEERERLRDRLAALGEMAAMMAHEIKNPLGAIEVMASVLRRQISAAPEPQSIVRDIIQEAKVANAIVQEMLEFVRPVRLHVARASLADAVAAALLAADGKVARGNVQVDIALPGSLPDIHGDQLQLTQVFANLLINAYEALGGSGRVTMSARVLSTADAGALQPDGHRPVPTVIVEVSDSGPGIPAALTDKVFNPFVTSKAQGSGLGLAIVRKIVDAHDGRIDVASAPGQGTRFSVTLPIDAAGSARESNAGPGARADT